MTTRTLQSHPVRRARKDLGWSEEKLARETGLSRETVRAIEAGRPPRIPTAQQVCRALGKSLDELFPIA